MRNLENLDLKNPTLLCEMMRNHGSDKGMCHHNYSVLYFELFKDIQNEKLNIFEMGLGTNNVDVPSNMGKDGVPGASLRAWRDFFKKSLIYGGDIDKRILFTEDRIQTYYCDQTNKEVIIETFQSINLKFDIIIDDGLHNYIANICMLESCIEFLKDGGYYIIEDVKESEINIFNEYINENSQKYEYINLFCLENTKNIFNDNNLIVIKK
jgi:hypothetical protein